MAKLNEISVMAILCLTVGGVLLSPGLAVEDIDEPALSPGPSYSDSDPIDSELVPSSGDSKFLNECSMKMYPECGEEIFGGMFSVDDVVPTKPCCARLVDMGKKCHEAMVKALLAIPELRPDASRALIKSERIWNACDSDGAISPS